MAKLTVQPITQSGISPTFSAADVLGDSFPNDGKSFVQIKNGGVSSITATVNSVKQCDQGFDHDLLVTINAGAEKIIGPFSTYRFNNESGEVGISYSAVASVTVAVFRT